MVVTRRSRAEWDVAPQQGGFTTEHDAGRVDVDVHVEVEVDVEVDFKVAGPTRAGRSQAACQGRDD